ncbi:MAG: hypothetical protein KAS32_13470 [Candidatus Peribacteraceae bacterium]|nr:hypothetical protein [Candidatus Peribacteraceae bacterium]
MEVHLMYKCRNCQEKFTTWLDAKGGTDGKNGEILLKIIESKDLIRVHDCGSKMSTTFGIADVIGIMRG